MGTIPQPDSARKRCSACDTIKPLSDFGNDKNRPDLHRVWCKECERANGRARRAADLDRAKERDRRYREANRDTIKGHRDSHRAKPEKHEKHLEENRQHRASNRQYFRDHLRQWRKDNPEKNREYDRRNRQKTGIIRWHLRQARKRLFGGSFTRDEWLDVCASYNHTCLRCGRREPDIKLTPDHVIPVALGGSSDIGNIQPLCGPCNSSKGAKTTDYR